MAKNTFSIPDEKGKIIQYNNGDSIGNVMTSFGIDFDTVGKINIPETTKVYFDKVTESNFSNKILGFIPHSTDKLVAFGGGNYYNFTIDSYSTYSQQSGGSTDTTNGDGVFWDSLILASNTTTIKSSTDGTFGIDWWQTTRGQSALIASSLALPRLMKVGADGNLYISDNGNKIYRVTASTVTKTGAGTLDFSATNHIFRCMEPSSNRMWIGTKNIGGKAAIIEWDLSASASTANRVHNMGAEAVMMIIIVDDNPVAILSDGKVKIFDGEKFINYEKMRIRVPKGYKLADNFVHRNGWDFIDGKPHIAISGLISTTSGKNVAASNSTWLMPSGVYCMDEDKGLYLRYTFGSGDNTRSDYAQVAVTDVGALRSVNGLKGKFLVSYESMLTDSTYNPTLAYHNAENDVAVKAWLLTTFAMSFREMWSNLELFHKALTSGQSIKLYTRTENTNAVTFRGSWVDNKTFNSASVGTGIVKGDLALIKMGNGAGQWMRIESVNESSTVTSIIFETTNSFVSAGNYGTIDVLDLKYMGTIDDTTQDYHQLTVPSGEKKRKRQFLLEFTKPAGTTMELDYIIAST